MDLKMIRYLQCGHEFESEVNAEQDERCLDCTMKDLVVSIALAKLREKHPDANDEQLTHALSMTLKIFYQELEKTDVSVQSVSESSGEDDRG
jgi:hypothetical protein